MTGIETIRIEGWGGSAEIKGLVVEADYQPGLFEAAELGAATLSILTGAAGVVLGFALVATGFATLSGICYGAAVLALGVAVVMWMRAFDGLRARGERFIHLSLGWIEVGNEIRWLRDATLDVETSRIGFSRTYARLALVFPDGKVVLLAQGPVERIRDLVHALRYAPCVTQPRTRRAA